MALVFMPTNQELRLRPFLADLPRGVTVQQGHADIQDDQLRPEP